MNRFVEGIVVDLCLAPMLTSVVEYLDDLMNLPGLGLVRMDDELFLIQENDGSCVGVVLLAGGLADEVPDLLVFNLGDCGSRIRRFKDPKVSLCPFRPAGPGCSIDHVSKAFLGLLGEVLLLIKSTEEVEDFGIF